MSSATNLQRVVGARDYAVVALIALAVAVPGIMNDFVYDDLAIIRDNVRVHSLSRWRELVALPYWPPPFVEQLYRPVAVLLLAIEYALGGGHPIAFRLASCAMYVASCISVLRLAARILPGRVAVAVAVLFAAHPVHVEAVALGVNQGELVVAVIGVAMTVLYLDARLSGCVGFRRWAVLAALYSVAALTKENGFVLPGLLVCAELTVVRARSHSWRVSETLSGFSALMAVGVGLMILRAAVLPEMGVIPAPDLRGLGIGGRVLAMLEVVPTWFRLLAFPATLRVDYHLSADVVVAGTLRILGVMLASGALALMYLARREAPAVSFGLAWCVVALLPVSNVIPTGVLVAERTLFLASIGFLVAVGGAAQTVLSRSDDPALRQRLAIAFVILTTLGMIKSAVRELSWNSTHVRVVGPRRPPV